MTDTIKGMIDNAANSVPEPPAPPKPVRYGTGHYTSNEKGLYFVEPGGDGEAKEKEIFVCSKLSVTAETRDDKGNNHGRLLAWHDSTDKRLHQWAMPLAMLAGDGLDVRKELMDGGLVVSPGKKARDLLSIYIQICKPSKLAKCVDRLGWHDGRYILPDQTLGGDESETVVFQNPHMVEPAFSASGTAEQWKKHVAALAAGNTRVVFAISTIFAGALLDITDMEGGGFHLCGSTTRGKTTSQLVAASVFGKPGEYKRSWRATANALEGLAQLHNDATLILDEIKEISPKDAGVASYMLANGCAKTRMNKNATTRKAATWKLLFLSSGEIGLPELMRQAGERAAAGQEIRLVEIDIGDFENLHDYETPGKFADALRDNAGKYYGAVGLEYLRQLVITRDKQDDVIKKCIDNFISNTEVVPDTASGQVFRVAKRFGLVAAAGELATDFGLTGWPQGESIKAAQACFKSWLDNYGVGDRESSATLAQVRLFFEQNGASRFQKMTDIEDTKIVNRAGFYEIDTLDDKTYYVLPEAFKHEVCRGLNYRTAIKTLINAGWLKPGSDKSAQKVRIPAMGSKPTSVYVFNREIWDTES